MLIIVILEPPLVRLIPVPATNVDPPLIVTVNEPAPVAVANDIFVPAANAIETAVPVTELAPALNDWVPAAPPAPAESVIELPLAVPDRPPVSDMAIWFPIVNVPVPAVFPVMLPLIVE